MVFALSTNAKTFCILCKKVRKKFGDSENSRTFASAFAQKGKAERWKKSSLKDLHRQRKK